MSVVVWFPVVITVEQWIGDLHRIETGLELVNEITGGHPPKQLFTFW